MKKSILFCGKQKKYHESSEKGIAYNMLARMVMLQLYATFVVFLYFVVWLKNYFFHFLLSIPSLEILFDEISSVKLLFTRPL